MEKVETIGLGELTFLFQLVGPQTKIRGEIIPSRTRIPRSVQGSGHVLALRLRYRGERRRACISRLVGEFGSKLR